ncbi:type II secretion system protein N [Brevundimonas sp.]|uniref:type II secretion system protein N n=1 Tax=Brevundimonas sp. TaxID=1871086 RepID=UPI00289E581A|nr:type II secretion system protein N [Brevundimonas sp.]
MALVLQGLRTSGFGNVLAADTLRRGLEVLLIVILLVQAGRLVWLFAAPAPDVAVRSAPKPDTAILGRYDPFVGASVSAAVVDTTGFTLFGVSADGLGGGSAIIGGPDGVQVSVAVGEAVTGGVTLKSVGPDHVTLARGDTLSRLYFPDVTTDVAAPVEDTGADTQSEAAPANAAAVVNPARLMAQAGLRPRLDGLRVTGLTVTASDEASELAAAGLQNGDVILSVNGTALTSPQALNTLRERLANAPSAEISFERGGQRRMTTITTR